MTKDDLTLDILKHLNSKTKNFALSGGAMIHFLYNQTRGYSDLDFIAFTQTKIQFENIIKNFALKNNMTFVGEFRTKNLYICSVSKDNLSITLEVNYWEKPSLISKETVKILNTETEVMSNWYIIDKLHSQIKRLDISDFRKTKLINDLNYLKGIK